MREDRMRGRRQARAARGIFLFVVFLLAVALASGAFYLGFRAEFSSQAVEATIRSWGAWGIAASIGLMVLHSFVPFPAEFLAIANGMVYGTFWGVVITWTGAMLGAFLAFGLARALGRPFVDTVISGKGWQVLDDWTAVEGGQLLLVSRLVPVIAFNLVNYAAGLTRISWWTFAWATGIGILPLTVVMVAVGKRIHLMTWEIWLLSGVAAVILWFVFRGWLRRWVRRAGPPTAGDG